MTYTVYLRPSNQHFTVAPQETLLTAALKHNLLLPYNCRGGSCGACKATLLSGQISYLEQPTCGDKINSAQGDILLCQAIANTDLEINSTLISRVCEISDIKRMPCRVERLHKLSNDVMQLWLKIPEHESLYFQAGQYLDVVLKDGRRRSFSIASTATELPLLELHIRRVNDGSFTQTVFDTMKVKDILRIELPLGMFFLRHDTLLPILFVAGGTGFAPVKAMIQQAIMENRQREMVFYWGVRSKQDLYMHAEIVAWTKTYSFIRYIPVLSDPLPEDNWQGKTGLVHEVVSQDIPHLVDYVVYASGPPVMVAAAHQQFLAQGLPAEQFYSDPFEFAKDKK
ncbi:2Fe-2S iron-sulfur cluster-binding protein [Beggiatoa leptomitoformis]|uniref:2Fe-2S iron-sulfur cluster binding domain-containing protein n=1 Tax=Beggiatoa leptomitoformis TaxID=288004 RepID=A0A2N9YJD0_9GAMM|nr:2Fe-2S iron-sulfur cluster-binding protein [Beggiatoa leptomitoformis]ALG69487.1 2Fe-2S iron-sulfur cluster binding domain-containing protein [Beggiatoa leptomitoformis]AUI70608.1 2Fe-2S iron-sulfur cluster binding domain-containing protein [Beggiatoa leptomitoformis]